MALLTIGEIRCNESIGFLNELLDDYISKMPKKTFDPSKLNWKYKNVDFFFILESMVRQQNKKAIPHLKNARDSFPENYVDHKVCQIAIGRIKKGHLDGFLPLEYLDIAIPFASLMNLFSGGKTEYKDNFDQLYGEYFDDEYYNEMGRKIKGKKKSKKINHHVEV